MSTRFGPDVVMVSTQSVDMVDTGTSTVLCDAGSKNPVYLLLLPEEHGSGSEDDGV